MKVAAMTEQLSFFAAPIQLPVASRDRSTGRHLAERGAEIAAAKADRDNAGWFAAALSFFLAFARKTAPGSTFATEDVRHASAGLVPSVQNGRAWGNVARAASRLKQIEWSGYAQCSDPKSHGAPRSAWRFVGERV